jgi:hypothetical protein
MDPTTDSNSNFNPGPTGASVGPIGNVLGDVQKGFEEADHIIEFTTYKAENHARVEPMTGSFFTRTIILKALAQGNYLPEC